MIKLIIFGVIVLVIFFTRKIWSRYVVLLVLKFKNREKRAPQIEHGISGSVFSPKGTRRTFSVVFDIEEMGDGTAKITLGKVKE